MARCVAASQVRYHPASRVTPLKRGAVGQTRTHLRIKTAVLVALLVSACDARVYRARGEQIGSPKVRRQPANPAYFVVRPVFEAATADATSSALVYGRTFYFSNAKLLDLSDFDFEDPIEQSNKSEPSKTAVALKLTPEGSRILGQWSERNIGSRLGLFLDGTLTDAPEIKSRIDGIIPVGTEFSPQEAAVISARLRRGGAK